MSAAPVPPAAKSTLQRVQCWLLTLALLLQSVWLPFHLATERHLAPGSDLASAGLALGEPHASCSADGTRDPWEPPHSILDHQDQKHVRGDDHDGAQTIANGLDDDDDDDDDDDGDGTPLPLAWLADAPHELPIGRAPPDAKAPFHTVPFACPQRLPAAPRAPPQV